MRHEGYYDRRGFPIDLMEWAARFESGYDRIVAQSRHKEAGKEIWLSTVHIGLDHSFGGGPPLIFETMAFEVKPTAWNSVVGEIDMGGIYQRRYTTEDQALAGHDPWEAVQ